MSIKKIKFYLKKYQKNPDGYSVDLQLTQACMDYIYEMESKKPDFYFESCNMFLLELRTRDPNDATAISAALIAEAIIAYYNDPIK